MSALVLELKDDNVLRVVQELDALLWGLSVGNSHHLGYYGDRHHDLCMRGNVVRGFADGGHQEYLFNAHRISPQREKVLAFLAEIGVDTSKYKWFVVMLGGEMIVMAETWHGLKAELFRLTNA